MTNNETEIHLVSHLLCPYVQRSVIMLEEKQTPFKRTDINLDNLPEWFKKISPTGKVPLLIAGDNRVLFESAVICEYIDEITPGTLHPEDPFEKAKHRAWIEFGSGLLDDIAGLYWTKDEAAYKEKRLTILQKLLLLENEVSQGPFFSGDEFQIIDTVYAPIFRYFDVFDLIVDLDLFTDCSKINAWRFHLRQRGSVKQAVTPDYASLLLHFLKGRDSHMSGFISN